MNDLEKRLKKIKIHIVTSFLFIVLIALQIVVMLLNSRSTVNKVPNRQPLNLIIMSIMFLIAAITWLVERIRIIIFAFNFKDKTSAVLMLAGFVFDIIGIVGLFILKKQVKQLILSTSEDNQNESNNDFGR